MVEWIKASYYVKDMGGSQFLYCMPYTAGIEGATGITLKQRISLVISSFSSCRAHS
jgi:hypothetical protein